MFQPIDLDIFEARTGIGKSDFADAWTSAHSIVSLRDVVSVVKMQAMSRAYLGRLIRNIGMTGMPNEKPYESCEIQLVRMDPESLLIGQTFVERPKYQALLERFSGLFSDFSVTRGIAKCTAYIVLGRLRDGSLGIAHYIPPIVEDNRGQLLLMDGIHRNFLVRAVGTTIEAVVVRGVSVPFPCEPQPWSVIGVVEQKPPTDKRFFGLKPELFRDVKSIGIDG